MIKVVAARVEFWVLKLVGAKCSDGEVGKIQSKPRRGQRRHGNEESLQE